MAAKRFTDSGKWNKRWFRKLTPKMKCVWFFFCDQCDAAGMLDLDIEAVSFNISEEVTFDEIKDTFKDHITIISDYKIYINDFIKFQYGELKPNNNAHISVLNKLQKYNIEGLVRSSLEDQDKDKDKDKEKEIIKNKNTILVESNGSTDFNQKTKKDVCLKKRHWFESFVFDEMKILDTGLAMLSRKIEPNFGSESGFREWVKILTSTKKFQGMSRDEQLRYFAVSLNQEISKRESLRAGVK